jgi:hypothetical protein
MAFSSGWKGSMTVVGSGGALAARKQAASRCAREIALLAQGEEIADVLHFHAGASG